MSTDVLDEYLERYSGGEYVFAIVIDFKTGNEAMVIFRLMEKTVLRYPFFSEYDSHHKLRYVVYYNDGTRKILDTSRYGINDDHYNINDTIENREEIHKLGRFSAGNMEVVDIIGLCDDQIEYRKAFDDPIIINIGDIISRFMTVATYKTLCHIINKAMRGRLITYLCKKK